MNNDKPQSTHPIQIMVTGLPGNVAKKMALHALEHPDFELIPFSFTGPEIETPATNLEGVDIQLVKPMDAQACIDKVKSQFTPIIIDYTHPSAVNRNAEFYVANALPFVMGTTGGDREALHRTVTSGTTPAVIAPNMMKQIVGLQAMFEYAAKNFPDLFKGFSMRAKESHQQGKADTSGTAKAMVQYFNQLGIDFKPDEIVQERDPIIQENEWGIPREYLGGHGWHTYSISADDGFSFFEFTHNINGRDVYVPGTYDAVRFLHKKLGNANDNSKRYYTMIDVLKGK